jgi:5-methylcytosine-specific restriction endonuclease McrA
MITRVCKKCGEEKVLEDLVKSPSSKYGRAQECRTCRVKSVMAKTDPVTKAAYDKKRRELKKEELRAYDRERAKLPHRRAAHNEDTRKRRAKLKDAIPEDYDREGVLSMYKLAQKISTVTGVEMHVDHILPIACGGEHNVKNLQLLAGSLNLAKGANPHFQLSWKSYPNGK